ncbi:cytochrome P450 [Kribbella deserti]|uniref:Cytochrome P450 n=1 Tax=Kribbella deserti TaxID=1926257 RepID=A0ABV6QIZ2_9ACTN
MTTPLLDTRTLDRRTARTLPPGPRLPMLLQTILFASHRSRFFPWLRRRYGDVATIRIVPRGRVVVVLSDPADIRTLFSLPITASHSGEGNAVLQPIMGDHSLLILDEDEHLRIRKQLMPAFHGHALRGYRDLIADLAEAEVASWTPGQPLRLADRMRALTLEIILQVVFGMTDGERLDRLRPLLDRVVSVNPVIMLGGFYPRLLRYPPWRWYVDAQREADKLLYDEIAARRASPDLAGRTDVLSRLLQNGEWSDLELRDQLVTLLLAGHETTATSLAWTLHDLARLPEVLRKAQTGGDEYLEAVTKESLRRHPVIYQVGRRLTETVELAGYHLPRGTTVMAAIGLVHADPAHYPEPEVFRPERFIEGQPAPWIPFGGGVRRCLGAGFSMLESTEILRATLARYTLHAPDPTPETPHARNVTLTPSNATTLIPFPR